jgi:hypothetical protein
MSALARPREALLGVDMGLTGAIALIEESGELIAVHDMSCLAEGPKRAHAVRGIGARTSAVRASRSGYATTSVATDRSAW